MIHTLGFSPSLDVVYTVDSLTVGQIHRPTRVIRSAGGKSLNVARAVAILGRPVRAIVPLGGRIGELVADLLDGSGVQLDRIETSAETRMCVTVSDESASGDPTSGDAGATLTEFYEAAPVPGAAAMDAIANSVRRIPAGDILAVSGSVPAALEATAIVAVLADAAQRGIRIAIDVHGPALGGIITGGRPWIVKVNRGEAAALTGLPPESPLPEHAAALRALGAAFVVLTDGIHGSYGADADGTAWTARSLGTPGRYAVGSGDSYFAGLLTTLEDGEPIAEALRTAAACGTANAQTPGAATFDLAAVVAARATTDVERAQ